MMNKFAAILLAFTLAACAEGELGEGPASDTARDPSPLDYVKMTRTPCFGACPVYELTLYGDGRQVFHGTRFTKVKGQQTRQASSGRFLDAVAEMELREFLALKDNYTRDVCKLWATDHPSVTIELRMGETEKTVNWYTGCRGMPEQARLERLVGALEDIMEVEVFIGTDAERAALRRP